LVAEEWAEEAASGPRLLLDPVQRDWLSLTFSTSEPPARAAARLLLAFLWRAEQSKERPETARFSTVMRQPLLDLPQAGFPESFAWEGQEMRLPKIVAVCPEAAPAAELFWCYGFYGESRGAARAGVVLLIAVCDEPPADSQIQEWYRELENEGHVVQPGEAARARSGTGTGLLQELWVAVPPETSLAPTAGERRFSWQTFFRLVAQAGSPERNPPSPLGE
jgi:hypothetical protein